MSELSFSFKKIITFFIEPYGLFLSLLLIGIYFLFKKKYQISNTVFIFLFSFMLLFAYPPFSNFLIENLEDKYVKYNYSNNVKYIHVLGSGHIVDKSQPISSLINDGGIKRVVEGVIIHKNIPNSKLIFTGYSNKTDISNASMNAKLAMALGVSSENIIISELEKDTKDESIFVKSIVGSERFVLVTSATHMTRSLKLFKEIGLKPIPAPTDFKKNKTSSYFQFPSISALEETHIAIHEYLGLLWNKMKKRKI